MLLDLFKTKPVLDEESVQWLIDVYAWALNNFDAEIFYQHTQLVLPSNEFFPGRADSHYAMASLIFDKVKQYAHMQHWPCQLIEQSQCQLNYVPQIAIEGAPRRIEQNLQENPVSAVNSDQHLIIQYDANQVRNPEAIIATFAHNLAHYLGTMAEQNPPGVEENWPQMAEVLGVFMGFGVIFANSAFNFKNITCGSCSGPATNRNSFLSQYDITYALAIFTTLKEIPNKQVLSYLKSSLKPFFKKAMKELKNNSEKLDILRKIDKNSSKWGD